MRAVTQYGTAEWSEKDKSEKERRRKKSKNQYSAETIRNSVVPCSIVQLSHTIAPFFAIIPSIRFVSTFGSLPLTFFHLLFHFISLGSIERVYMSKRYLERCLSFLHDSSTPFLLGISVALPTALLAISARIPTSTCYWT